MDSSLEYRARRICEIFGIDPDEIVDDYGPVRNWDLAVYHIVEYAADKIEALQEIASYQRGGVIPQEGPVADRDRMIDLARTALPKELWGLE